jgi:hypothetical protein
VTPETIRDAMHSSRPFRVRTADGNVFDVPHQDFAAISEDGRNFVVMTGKSWKILDVPLITAIEVTPSAA